MLIHGKEYKTVAERLNEFHEKYPKGEIFTVMSYDGDWVRCRAEVRLYEESECRSFTGHAEENRTDGTINRTSATENCETSAVGRALGFLGLGSLESIASAEEVISAVHKQENPPTVKNEAQTYDPLADQVPEYNSCSSCGANVKKPYKICYPCKMGK